MIDGKGTPNDFMYAHLAEPSPLQEGETVRTGQPIGIVGDTGDAQGCHLHFEIWGAARLVRGRLALRPPSLPAKSGTPTAELGVSRGQNENESHFHVGSPP